MLPKVEAKCWKYLPKSAVNYTHTSTRNRSAFNIPQNSGCLQQQCNEEVYISTYLEIKVLSERENCFHKSIMDIKSLFKMVYTCLREERFFVTYKSQFCEHQSHASGGEKIWLLHLCVKRLLPKLIVNSSNNLHCLLSLHVWQSWHVSC